MAREFDGPLTKADLAWLEARYSEGYISRMVALHGVKKGGKSEPKVEEPENGSEKADGDDSADVFDVIGSTEAEVKTWADSADAEAKAAWLEARYISRMAALHGVKKGGKSEPKVEEPENGSEKADGKVEGTDAPEGTEGAGDGTEEPEEDLIGDGDDSADVFDVIGSTEAEVKTWADSADAEAKAAALATESAREDRDPRKGVVALLS